jgi:hypothetical protein
LLGPVNSGTWYDTAYSNLIADLATEFLLPIIFAIDETSLSNCTHMLVTGINFTTSIYNLKTRSNPKVYRLLGYVPNERNYYSKKQLKTFDSDVKSYRMHQMLEVILQSFKEAQSNGSLNNFSLKLGNLRKTVNLKVPLFFIIGDMQGGDKLAGRRIYYGINCKRISCSCNGKAEIFGNYDIGCCTCLIMSDIMALFDTCTEQTQDQLFNLYQQPHWNSFFDLQYGHQYGIFTAACPTEALHALENGLIKDTLNEIFHNIFASQQLTDLDAYIQQWCLLPKQHYMSCNNNNYP